MPRLNIVAVLILGGLVAAGVGSVPFSSVRPAKRLKPTLRQVHTAGERVFVDFSGRTMEVIDGAAGEIRHAEIFVGVLGASSYTFAAATWSQSLPDWIALHVSLLAFLAGVPRQIVSDNLRAGITRACFYEPSANRSRNDGRRCSPGLPIIRNTATPPMPLVAALPAYRLRGSPLTRSQSRFSLNVGEFGAVARMSTAAPFPRRSSSRSLA